MKPLPPPDVNWGLVAKAILIGLFVFWVGMNIVAYLFGKTGLWIFIFLSVVYVYKKFFDYW